MSKWQRGCPDRPGRYVCVVKDPKKGTMVVHMKFDENDNVIVSGTKLKAICIVAYKQEGAYESDFEENRERYRY